MARNAMTDEDKLLRRRELIAAAHQLYRERGMLPPVADIAKAAGLAKGTVYLYFSTKEEIFIALLEDDFIQLLGGLTPLLESLAGDPGMAARDFATTYSQSITALPDLLPLAAVSSSILERNLPMAAMLHFKTLLARELERNGLILEARFRQLNPGDGATLLLRTYALTLGLWQSLDYPSGFIPELERPALQTLKRDFPAELAAAVIQLWRGALTG